MEESLSPAASAFFYGLLAASLAVLFFLFQRHLAGRPLLAYEPRQRVPWNILAVAIMLSPTVMNFLTLLLLSTPAEPPSFAELAPPLLYAPHTCTTSPTIGYAASAAASWALGSIGSTPYSGNFLAMAWATLALMIPLAIFAYVALNIVCNATLADLGLPSSAAQWGADVRLGTLVFLASLAPVLILNIGLTLLLKPETQHPLIEQLQSIQSPGIFLVAALLAVVQAPLFEETAFRLVLQGWLEKWEDRLTGFAATRRYTLEDEFEPARLIPLEESDGRSHPARRLISWLPHGWAPILISGTLFGLAHWGHGVDPFALVLLGVILGYVYQRTHRIVPCIVAHALFNGFTMVLLWLTIQS